MNSDATRVIELTPPGRGAVAVVLVAGPDAARAVGQIFAAASGRPLDEAPLGRILLGRWGGPDGEEVIVCRRTIDELEVHCHGGAAAVRGIVQRLRAQGCRRCNWQGWLQHREIDPLRRAARLALAEAPTLATAAVLLDQFHGALSAALLAAADAISEEQWQPAADTLDGLIARGSFGTHLTRPWRVVLAGPPNVGKSSLLNALAGFQRAIVSPLPGTTRDIVTCNIAIDGWPVELADTAGLRENAANEIEAAGMGLAGSAIAEADLVIVMHDVSVEHRGTSPGAASSLHVYNKSDLLPIGELPANLLIMEAGLAPPPLTSAVTGEGIAELVAAIGQTLVPNPPPAGTAVPFQADQLTAIERARQAVHRSDQRTARDALQSLLAL
jgi:tRNA modification GTPase